MQITGCVSKSFIILPFVILVFAIESVFGSVAICSWNLQDFGASKGDKELEFMATLMNKYDIIAIQEVTTRPAGAQAVARLVDMLNRKGKSWDYTISDPTTSETGHSSERYAFIWNKSSVTKVGRAFLEVHYKTEVDREPYLCTFKKEGKEFTIGDFHAKPKSKKPESDIRYLKYLPTLYPSLNLILCGDFNCPQSNEAFNSLKKIGYTPAFVGQKTTLKMKCIDNNCLASEYDNFYFDHQKFRMSKSGVEPFYKSFPTVQLARKVSDHLPIYLVVE